MQNKANIVLVGFMGSGKTTVGRLLAERLSMKFVDMDDIIVERAGKPIPRIFAEDGEPRFRAMERTLVQDLAAETGLVVGAGGGIVTNADNVTDFSRTGRVICLSAAPQALLERVQTDTNRPLLAGDDKMEKIRSLLDARQHLYDAIPDQLDTTGLTAAQVADEIVQTYRPS